MTLGICYNPKAARELIQGVSRIPGVGLERSRLREKMLERFIREYSGRGYHFAYRLCGSTEEAKELVQEAFFRAMRNWDKFDGVRPLESWFLRILKNVYLDSIKRYDRRRGLSLDAPVRGEEDETLSMGDTIADSRDKALLDELERKDAGARVVRVLETLSPEHKAVLTLCDMEGLTYDEIGRVLDLNTGTVRSRVSRAREAFKKALELQAIEVTL